MADNIHNSSSGTGGSSGAIIFIVGGLVVAVAVLAWLFTGGEMPSGSDGAPGGDINVDVQAPVIEDGGSAPADGAADGAAGGGDAAGGN